MIKHTTKLTTEVIGSAILMSVAFATPARGAPAQQTDMPRPVAYEEELVTVPVTVENIDKQARTIVVRAPDGAHSTVKVPEDVQGLDRLKKGEKIDLTYYKAVAVSVVPGGSSAAVAAQPKSDTKRTSASPSHSGGKRVTSSATVTSVNKNGSVEVKNQNGESQTVTAKDASVEKSLQGLQPGDVIQIIYTEAVATSLVPPAK
jgi:hypothetical protein